MCHFPDISHPIKTHYFPYNNKPISLTLHLHSSTRGEALHMGKDTMDINECGDYDWEKEVKQFEKTKAGVKGLVDSGITKVPRFFICPSGCSVPNGTCDDNAGRKAEIPVIDFEGMEKGGVRRSQIVDEIREASEKWGFFQMINHGVPQSAMDEVLESTRRFHEQPKEDKMDLYSSDGRRPLRFYTINGSLRKSDVPGWRDAFACTFPDDSMINADSIPSVCRSEITEYMKSVIKLRDLLSELLSEALGLNADFLEKMECMKSEYLTCLYYPACPEPEKTLGAVKHSDPTALTLLLQDGHGGLQIHHEGDWLDVPPVHGALIANLGDFLQLMTNDKFKSVEHRVLATRSGSRVSAACFFFPGSRQMTREYGPIEELLTERNPPLYREVNYVDFVTSYQTKVRQGKALYDFQIVQKSLE